MIDVVEVTEPFDAARFVSCARKAIDEIQHRGRVAILCGGTGLYFKGLIEGLGDTPSPDPALRAALETTSLRDLLTELAERDPITHARIDRQNLRRVVRAVEVIRLTGKPFSDQRARWATGGAGAEEGCALGLSRAPGDLWARIETSS